LTQRIYIIRANESAGKRGVEKPHLAEGRDGKLRVFEVVSGKIAGLPNLLFDEHCADRQEGWKMRKCKSLRTLSMHGDNQMKLKNTLKIFALIGFISPVVGYGGSQADLTNCETRPLSDFLDAQGSTQFFFPPVADMLGWTDLGFEYFALVDYAGLADDYVETETGDSLGTKMTGRVLECATDDGRTKISVVLNTRKALGFAQSVQALIDSGFDFLNTPTVFGVKAQDVVVYGDVPALGPASLRVSFFIEAPGDPLPDIRSAFQENIPDVRPISLDFRSTTIGYLPDGTKARLRVQQVAASDAAGDLVFSREIVDFNRK